MSFRYYYKELLPLKWYNHLYMAVHLKVFKYLNTFKYQDIKDWLFVTWIIHYKLFFFATISCFSFKNLKKQSVSIIIDNESRFALKNSIFFHDSERMYVCGRASFNSPLIGKQRATETAHVYFILIPLQRTCNTCDWAIIIYTRCQATRYAAYIDYVTSI